jgi:hypothetical protein
VPSTRGCILLETCRPINLTFSTGVPLFVTVETH